MPITTKKIPLHFQILIGIVVGVVLGLAAGTFTGGPELIANWVKPIGEIFIRLLKLIAVPLIFVSLTKGISDLKDLSTLSRMGVQTVAWYMATTVFICQVLGHELAWSDQLIIVLTATLASIGAAGAPSAGIVMLVIVLESVGFPSENLPLALAMILAVDRLLDMCRTVVNISGDSCVAVLVESSLKKQLAVMR
ncbi:MAG: Na+/H+-dicarboxylate symporter [Neolewinella sp.]|jgi:Na+/H+-dicarboxylate symporter